MVAPEEQVGSLSLDSPCPEDPRHGAPAWAEATVLRVPVWDYSGSRRSIAAASVSPIEHALKVRSLQFASAHTHGRY
jgi:hypothetical protein